MGSVDDVETDTADKIFSLLWLPYKIEMIRCRAVCRNVNPYTALGFAKVKECPDGMFRFFKML
jgi:hypothetical protein